MKRMLLLVLVLALVGGMQTAWAAEPAVLEVEQYDFRNDLAEHQYAYYDLSEAQTLALRRGALQVHNMLPLADGALLFVGSFVYDDLAMEESFLTGHEQLPERMEAYAIALDAEGKRLWSLRIGDPQAYNDFERAWLLEDGRILLKYMNRIGQFGSHFFIVNMEGEVEEMLPTNKLREAGQMEAFRWIGEPEGFLSGGYHFSEDGAIGYMTTDDEIAFIRPDYTVAWRLQDDSLIGANMFNDVRQAEDGFLFNGLIYRDQNGPNIPTVLKVHSDGEIAWRFIGHEHAMVRLGDAWPTPDGGALVCAGGDPTEATPYEAEYKGTLVKLDAKGQHEWTRTYEAEGFDHLSVMVPFGEGFLIGGSMAVYDGVGLLYVGIDGEPLGVLRLPFVIKTGEYRYASMWLTDAPDGSVYVYGNETEWITGEDGQDVYHITSPYYAKVDEAAFQ